MLLQRWWRLRSGCSARFQNSRPCSISHLLRLPSSGMDRSRRRQNAGSWCGSIKWTNSWAITHSMIRGGSCIVRHWMLRPRALHNLSDDHGRGQSALAVLCRCDQRVAQCGAATIGRRARCRSRGLAPPHGVVAPPGQNCCRRDKAAHSLRPPRRAGIGSQDRQAFAGDEFLAEWSGTSGRRLATRARPSRNHATGSRAAASR
jgi:hypothetical protein